MNEHTEKVKKPCRRTIFRCTLLALGLLLVCISLYAGLDPYDNRITENVTVGGLDIGGMTVPEAYRALKSASETVLKGTPLVVKLPEESVSLSPADTGAGLKTFSALFAAYKAGRVEKQAPNIRLEPYLKLDRQYIRTVLTEYAARYDTDLTTSHYRLSGDMPDLEIESGQSRKPQTLEITMGLPTARFDQEDAFGQIMDVYDSAFAAAAAGKYNVSGSFRVDILEAPEAPDLQAIYEDVYIVPVDDSLDMNTYQIIQGSYGYRFDPDHTQKQVDDASFGDVISVPMEYEEPEIFGEDVYFRDVLGYCETKHTQDENRNHNLARACQSMNDVILQPGETFSYNETLGERTKENGYLRAGAYSGWELVMSYGGGICQGSSTLYCATLYADLEIVHRVNHGRKVGYMSPGLDATVSWYGPDFQFRNNTHFPVKIAAEVSDGFVKVTILGTEERDYYVEMETEVQYGSSVIYSKSYKCKYDRVTGELISRELEARSNYMT